MMRIVAVQFVAQVLTVVLIGLASGCVRKREAPVAPAPAAPAPRPLWLVRGVAPVPSFTWSTRPAHAISVGSICSSCARFRPIEPPCSCR
jgi:hypothetical protein